MGIFDSFGDVFSGIKDGFGSVFNTVKDIGGGILNTGLGFVNKAMSRLDRIGDVGDKALGAAGQLVGGAGNAAEGIGNFLGGNSNILLYIGVGLVAVMVLPKILDRVL